MYSLLLINDIIWFKDKNLYERLLWIDNRSNRCFTIQLYLNSLKIKERNIEDLMFLLNEYSLEICDEDPTINTKDFNTLSISEKELMDKAFAIISLIANKNNEPQCFLSHERRKLVLEVAKKYDISEKTVYKYLRLFWQGGRVKSSLLPKFSNCGGKGASREPKGKKLGRPDSLSYISGCNDGLNINDEIRKIFGISIKRYYSNQPKRKLTEAYRHMIKDFFSITEIVNGEMLVKPRPTTQIPTLRQFKYWFYKNRDLENETKEREGEKEFARNYRELKSDSTLEAFAPGFRYQVDATVADIYLVSRIDKSSVIGRPVIYLAVDVFSRMIAGVHVCLEGPNWNGMASLIYNCMEDKVEFCKKYGVEIKHADWPATGLPQVILGDRGELVGPVGETAIDNIGIAVENAPTGRGDAKGIVEQNFNIINTKIREWLPGAVKKGYRDGRKLSYLDEARLDLSEFTKIIILNILNRNKKLLLEYPVTQDMINDGIKLCPINIWNWGMKNKQGNLRRIPEELLRMYLMKRGKACITESGIRFEKMKYTCPDLSSNSFISARKYGRTAVEIVYDTRDISVIYYIDKESGKFLPCYLKEENIVFIGKTYEEVMDYHFIRSAEYIENKYEQNVNNLEQDVKDEDILKQNEIKNMGYKKNSHKNIKENKKKENDIFAKSQAFSNKSIKHESQSSGLNKVAESESQKPIPSRQLQRLMDRKKDNEFVEG